MFLVRGADRFVVSTAAMVRDPRGRDTFAIRVVNNGHTAELAFPNDACTITERLVNDLKKHLRLEVSVE